MKKFGVMILVLCLFNGFCAAGAAEKNGAALLKHSKNISEVTPKTFKPFPLTQPSPSRAREYKRASKNFSNQLTIINIDFWRSFDDPFLTEYIISAVEKLPMPAKKRLHSREYSQFRALCQKTAAQVADEYINLMCADSLILYQGNLVKLSAAKDSMIELQHAEKEYENLLIERQKILMRLTALTGVSLERGLSLQRNKLEEFDYNDVLDNPSYLIGCAQRADRETIKVLKEQRIKTIELQKKYLKKKDKDVSAQLLTEREKLLKLAQEQVRTKGERLRSYVDYYLEVGWVKPNIE